MTQKKKTVKKSTKVVPMKKTKYNTPVLVGIDFGCGQRKVSKEFFEQNINIKVAKVIGVDMVKASDEVDVVHDLTVFPYPFKDNSIDAIYASHFIEHLKGEDRWRFFSECARILKDGGRMRVLHPYWLSERAIQDCTHEWPPIAPASYQYYQKDWREANGLTHGRYAVLSNVDFDCAPFIYYANDELSNKSDDMKKFAQEHYVGIFSDMHCDMTKRPKK